MCLSRVAAVPYAPNAHNCNGFALVDETAVDIFKQLCSPHELPLSIFINAQEVLVVRRKTVCSYAWVAWYAKLVGVRK